MAVRDVLREMGLEPIRVNLGEVELPVALAAKEKAELDRRLRALGFELIDDRKSTLISQIKSLIIELVHHRHEPLKTNLSDYLSSRLNHEYGGLSSLFSEVEGTTIEKYYIAQKIEKVKELLVYDELTLSEIAYKLHYSSTAHLSNQFKKVTGLSPSHFKQIRSSRKPLDEV